jgi:hypothetical protein
VPTALDLPVLNIAIELEGANEPAVGSLTQVGRDLVALAQLPLALNGEDLPLDQDLDLLGFDAGQIYLNDEYLLVFANIDGRIPAKGAPGPVNEFVKDGVNLVVAEIQATPFHDPMTPADLDSAIAVA